MNKLILIMFLAICFSPKIVAEDVVQLLLVRDAKDNSQCDTDIIRGVLYAVPSSMNIEDVSASSFGIKKLTNTEELPYEGNVVSTSSIPSGTYDAIIRRDETKPWMKNNINRAWRLELLKTEPRSAIQFHYGKDKSWSAGCVILTGESSLPLLCKRDGTQNSSESAVKAVRDYVESILNSSDDRIVVKIVYQ